MPPAKRKAESVDEDAPAASSRGRKLRVKMAGQTTCSRDLSDSPSGGPAEAPSGAAEAPAMNLGAAPATAAAKFAEGDAVILYNGSLCYEAQVLEVKEGESGKKAVGKKKETEGASYLISYTKYPKRPEEWVNEAFVFAWSEQLIKNTTNRPPRKAMWTEQKAPGGPVAGMAMPEEDADAMEVEEATAAAAAAAAGAKQGRSSGRARAPTTKYADAAEEEEPAGRGSKRQRKPTEKVKEEAAAPAPCRPRPLDDAHV